MDGTFEVDTGAEDSLKAPGGYKAGVTTLINDSSATLLRRIVLLNGRMDGSNSNGQVTYLGGHDYSTSLPITSNPQTNGVRIFLNAIFAADCALSSSQGDPSLSLSAPAIVSGNTIPYSFSYTNPGPRPLENIRITDLLPTGATYVAGSASTPPTTDAGGALVWDLPTLQPGDTATLTFSLTVSASGDYPNSVQMLFSHLSVQTLTSNLVSTAVTTGGTTPGAGSGGGPASLPKTGFAPDRVTVLPSQPASAAYSNLDDLWLEIPSLHIRSSVVGVPPAKAGTWDVTWLGDKLGWLNGTAFPSWVGNSVITGHAYDSNGQPGPFANIKSLKYGDPILLHLYGGTYRFEVRSVRLSPASTTGFAFADLERFSYLTLLTCQGYDPASNSYLFRRIVRAVLVDVK